MLKNIFKKYVNFSAYNLVGDKAELHSYKTFHPCFFLKIDLLL